MEMTFLNNFYTILRTQMFGNTYAVGQLVTESTTASGERNILGNLKDNGGNSFTGMYNQTTTNGFGFFKNNNSYGDNAWTLFGVGSGRTAVSMDDYELASPITSGVSIARVATTSTVGITCNVVVNNTGNSDVSVSEIGLYDRIVTNTNDHTVLVARAVLDNPVVIPAGESKTFDVSLSLALPA